MGIVARGCCCHHRVGTAEVLSSIDASILIGGDGEGGKIFSKWVATNEQGSARSVPGDAVPPSSHFSQGLCRSIQLQFARNWKGGAGCVRQHGHANHEVGRNRIIQELDVDVIVRVVLQTYGVRFERQGCAGLFQFEVEVALWRIDGVSPNREGFFDRQGGRVFDVEANKGKFIMVRHCALRGLNPL